MRIYCFYFFLVTPVPLRDQVYGFVYALLCIRKKVGRIGQSALLIGNRACLCLEKGVVVAGLVKGAFLYGGCRSVGMNGEW